MSTEGKSFKKVSHTIIIRVAIEFYAEDLRMTSGRQVTEKREVLTVWVHRRWQNCGKMHVFHLVGSRALVGAAGQTDYLGLSTARDPLI